MFREQDGGSDRVELTASDLDDVRSLEQVAAGDREALACLYDRHSSLILGVLIRMLGTRGQAEEVLQETFLHAWRDARRYRSHLAPPLGWLLMLARFRALLRLRSQAGASVPPEPAAPAGPPLDTAAQATGATSGPVERSRRIEGALAQLPADQRECIELACFGGLTHAQIAARLNQPQDEIKSRIVSGMSRLRQALAPYV